MTTFQFKNRGFKTFGELVNELMDDQSVDSSNSFFPPANIGESKDNFEIELMVPGRNKEDFKISLDKNLLTIAFERKEEEKNDDKKIIKSEFSLRSFNRSFTIDEQINIEEINARYDNGLLTLTLPKKEEVKQMPKEISVQ